MSENSLWRNLRAKMVPDYWCQATRHEDKLQAGIADVSFVQDRLHGWMELKHIPLAPARSTTIVRCKHFSDDQRAFLYDKGRNAGGTFLLLQLERDYLLFDWDAAQHLGTIVEESLRSIACYESKGHLYPAGLQKAIDENW